MQGPSLLYLHGFLPCSSFQAAKSVSKELQCGSCTSANTVWCMQEAVLTKAYAVDANFSNADMTNAVIDRVDFTGAARSSGWSRM